ncbi:MAG: hypothetical protein NZM12_05830 [Steroidobacteraceae bacterium]|nr:hypothetical protein [Steroidobacteraceae bacterium]MDW8259767.1 hypothetical protein [Gammaproteobacteria bacterium]
MNESWSLDELLQRINAPSRGKRPQFFDHPDTDRLLSIILALVQELAVTRERLDTLERLLAQRGVVSEAQIDAYRPEPQVAQQRAQWQIEFLARVFRVLQQEMLALERGAGEESAEEVARELSR